MYLKMEFDSGVGPVCISFSSKTLVFPQCIVSRDRIGTDKMSPRGACAPKNIQLMLDVSVQ